MRTLTHTDTHDYQVQEGRWRGSHSCKEQPPDEGVPALVKMPLPCVPTSFVLRCQATPQPPGRAPPPITVMLHCPQSWAGRGASSRREMPRLLLACIKLPLLPNTPSPHPAPKRGL